MFVESKSGDPVYYQYTKISEEDKNEKISDQNLEILTNFANRTATNLHYKKDIKGLDFWSYVSKIFPSQETIKNGSQFVFDRVYSQQVSNNFITHAVRGYLPVQQTTGWFSPFINFFTIQTQNTAIEASKMALTPFLAPAFTILFGGATNIALSLGSGMLTLMLSEFYGKSTPEELVKLKGKSLEQLIQFDPKTNTYKNAFGEVFSEDRVNTILRMVQQYKIAYQLSSLKRGEVTSFLNQYLINVTDEKGDKHVSFLDGQILSEDKLYKMKKFLQYITTTNDDKISDHITKFVRNLAKHSVTTDPESKECSQYGIVKCTTKISHKEPVLFGYFNQKTGEQISSEECKIFKTLSARNKALDFYKKYGSPNDIHVDLKKDEKTGKITVNFDFLKDLSHKTGEITQEKEPPRKEDKKI